MDAPTPYRIAFRRPALPLAPFVGGDEGVGALCSASLANFRIVARGAPSDGRIPPFRAAAGLQLSWICFIYVEKSNDHPTKT